MRAKSVASVVSASAVFGAILCLKIVRPWYLRWGATDVESREDMPLDERVSDPNMVSTRAITIQAPAEGIWPWIVQMGDRPRAGYYSYAWVERLQGMRIENAERILPEYQSLTLARPSTETARLPVQYVDPGRALVLGPPDSVDGLHCTWAFALRPINDHTTRLVTRVRARVSYRKMLGGAPPYEWPFLLLLDPGAFVMERKMLMEIKRRAEQSCRPAARRTRVDQSVQTGRKGTLRERRKNSTYERLMNRVWFRLVASGLVPRRWPGSQVLGFTTLEVRGRKSGVMRRVPVTWVQVADERYLVAMMGEESDWVHNARATGGHVTFKRGHRRQAVLEELAVGERAPIIQAWYKRTGSSTPRGYVGLEPDAPLEAFEEISPRWPVFRITPEDALP